MAIFYKRERKYLILNKIISKYALFSYGIMYLIALYFVFTSIWPVGDVEEFSANILITSIVLAPILVVLILLLKKERINLFSYAKGLKGEEIVELELSKLPDNYSVITNIRIPPNKWNVDFIVVSDKNVFAIESKSDYGNISFDGHTLMKNGKYFDKNYLKQVRSEALAVCNFLEQQTGIKYVIPLLVFSNPGAKMNFGYSKPVDGQVYVINKYYLGKLFTFFEKASQKIDNVKTIALLKELTRL